MDDDDDLPSMLGSFLISGHYSDFAIICKDITFAVHRVVVCPQAPFFAAALNGKFLEGQNNRVNLPEDDPEAIARMLEFMYTRDYDEKKDNAIIYDNYLDDPSDVKAAPAEEYNGEASDPTSDDSEDIPDNWEDMDDENDNADNDYQNDQIVYNNLGVYIVAEKYGIKPLKELALNRFTLWLLKHDPTETLPELIRATMLQLPPYDRDLRDALSKYIAGNPEIMSLHGMYSVMGEFGTLAAGVLEGVLKERAQLTANNFSISHDRDSLRSKLDIRELDIALLRTQHEAAKSKLRTKLRDLSICRHCHADFNVSLDDYNW